MNLNVKLDGEEEQPLQYVNRFAINIPSGAAAFNLNIVNPGLGNQSYILNPVNPVGQNIVAYQPPMAVQSYIALPAEAEGNIIHSLPVGVPVPVGLSVPTGLLQNNFVNTSIIVGNENCSSSEIIKSSSNSLNPENEIKINYIEKPIQEFSNAKTNGIEVQSVGINCSPQTNAESIIKKPCPLEMSIKAANIEMEFEKCEPEMPILLDNCHTIVEKSPILVQRMPLQPQSKDNFLKVPLETHSLQTPNAKETESKKIKTEITWENNNKQESVDNGFRESLICEVEEANDDDDDDDDDDDEGDDDDEDEDDEDDEDEESEMEENTNCRTDKSRFHSIEGLSSSEESDSLPLSVALKLAKSPNSKSSKISHRKKIKKRKKEVLSNNKWMEDGRRKKRNSQRSKKQREGDGGGEREGDDWSESDDDFLNLKRIKNEFNYKCFYEPNPGKSATSLVLKIDDRFKKFVRVRSCCSKRECGKKISVQDQKTAHRNFYDLESDVKRDAYLMNCIEHIQKPINLDNAKEKYVEKTNIQLEIENESNGNQKLSDEIQKAINESLKDCAVNESRDDENKAIEREAAFSDGSLEKGEKNAWNFYIVIDRCRKKVCLQFLLKLFQIAKSRIKQLQKKILSGSPLVDLDSGRGNQKSDIWEVAKSHLEGLDGMECPDCNAIPRHRFLAEPRTKEDLFDSFKNFYFNKLGKEPSVKYASYKRFLDKKTSISFCSNKEGVCTECEEGKKHQRRKQSKSEKGKKLLECKKQWIVKTDSDERYSDDEPLLKRKKLKLTIPLKVVHNKTQQSAGKKSNSKKYSVENKSKGKSKQSGSRGRDVWSLMLLHLETMPYKECRSCVCKKKHRFLNSSFTTQSLFEDYRKYFLKETNSELGLGFTMYEKYFNRNCNYTISDVDVNAPNCPRCAMDETKS